MTMITPFDKSFGIPLSGRYFAHNRLNRLQRAFLAADLHAGKCRLSAPTVVQAAWIARVDRTAAWWASLRQAERAAIVDGSLPLVPPRTRARTVTDNELADTIRAAGIERTLMVASQVETAMAA
jgi:hypothetical protein